MSTLITLILGVMLGFGAGYIAAIVTEFPLGESPDISPLWLDAIDEAFEE